MYKAQTREILYYILYAIILLNVIVSILFLASDFVLTFFFHSIKEPLVLTDPALYAASYCNFILYLACLLAMPFILTTLHFYYKQLYYNTFWRWLKYFHAYCIYILFITFYIVKYDLHLSEWISMGDLSDLNINWDLQPNFEVFLRTFCALYNQFIAFNMFCIFIPFFLIIFGKIELSMDQPKKNLFYEVSLIYFLYIWILFYEYLFSNTMILAIISWIYMLLAHLFWLFLDYHVRYKKPMK